MGLAMPLDEDYDSDIDGDEEDHDEEGWEDDDDADDDDGFIECDDDEDLIDGVGFANPGGNSALRAATKDNPRDQRCPTCKTPNVLTRIDVQRGYQCDTCADRTERGGEY